MGKREQSPCSCIRNAAVATKSFKIVIFNHLMHVDADSVTIPRCPNLVVDLKVSVALTKKISRAYVRISCTPPPPPPPISNGTISNPGYTPVDHHTSPLSAFLDALVACMYLLQHVCSKCSRDHYPASGSDK